MYLSGFFLILQVLNEGFNRRKIEYANHSPSVEPIKIQPTIRRLIMMANYFCISCPPVCMLLLRFARAFACQLLFQFTWASTCFCNCALGTAPTI